MDAIDFAWRGTKSQVVSNTQCHLDHWTHCFMDNKFSQLELDFWNVFNLCIWCCLPWCETKNHEQTTCQSPHKLQWRALWDAKEKSNTEGAMPIEWSDNLFLRKRQMKCLAKSGNICNNWVFPAFGSFGTLRCGKHLTCHWMWTMLWLANGTPNTACTLKLKLLSTTSNVCCKVAPNAKPECCEPVSQKWCEAQSTLVLHINQLCGVKTQLTQISSWRAGTKHGHNRKRKFALMDVFKMPKGTTLSDLKIEKNGHASGPTEKDSRTSLSKS